MVATIPLMCLFNRHYIKHKNCVVFPDNLENNGVTSPDVHAIDMFCCEQAFYTGCTVRIFQQ